MRLLAKLMQLVHRRGLWQASAAFLGVAWAVLEVTDVFTGRGLLPDWAFTGALVVLALGFPVVLATAFVQSPRSEGEAASWSGPGSTRAAAEGAAGQGTEAATTGRTAGQGTEAATAGRATGQGTEAATTGRTAGQGPPAATAGRATGQGTEAATAGRTAGQGTPAATADRATGQGTPAATGIAAAEGTAAETANGIAGRDTGASAASSDTADLSAAADPAGGVAEGEGGGRDAAEAAAAGGRGPPGSLLPSPATRPSARSFLTWKRAVLGGVAAFAALGLAAAGFGVMRVTGIGPAGTLLAQGLIEEGGLVILADFRSSAGASAPGDLVTEALRIDLEQSPTIDLLDPRAVAAGLARMRQDPGETFSEDLAMELATREGAELVVSGDVGRVGAGYFLAGRLLNPKDGAVLASFRETARDSTELIDAIDALSGKIRSKVGEALRSVALSEPLYEATTASLEALRKFTFVAQREPRGALDGPRAIEIMEEAVALDTTFAEAYRYLSILIGNYGGSLERQAEAATRAFRYRDHLSPRKQLLAEANYYTRVTGEYRKAARAYRGLLDMDPSFDVAAVNLADLELYAGNYEEAEALLQDHPRPEQLAWSWNLMAALAGQRRYREAEEHLFRTREAQPENLYLVPTLALFLASTGRWREAVAELDSAPALPGAVEGWMRFVQASALARGGHFVEARESLDRMDELMADYSSPSERLVFGSARPFLSGWMEGDASRGAAEMASLLDRLPYREMTAVDRAHGLVALVYALMGASAEARSELERYREEVPAEADLAGRSSAAVAEALVRIQEGATPEEAGLVTAVDALNCFRCRQFFLGHGFEVAGDQERAIAAYEAYLADGFFDPSLLVLVLPTPVVHERLAALYEAAQDPGRALEHYRAFAEEWQDADPALQPRVERARRRIAALGGLRP